MQREAAAAPLLLSHCCRQCHIPFTSTKHGRDAAQVALPPAPRHSSQPSPCRCRARRPTQTHPAAGGRCKAAGREECVQLKLGLTQSMGTGSRAMERGGVDMARMAIAAGTPLLRSAHQDRALGAPSTTRPQHQSSSLARPTLQLCFSFLHHGWARHTNKHTTPLPNRPASAPFHTHRQHSP